MFCLHIFEWLAIWLMGWILEGQQLYTSGFGLEKYVWKINKPDTHMRAHMQPWASFSRHGGGKKKNKLNRGGKKEEIKQRPKVLQLWG